MVQLNVRIAQLLKVHEQCYILELSFKIMGRNSQHSSLYFKQYWFIINQKGKVPINCGLIVSSINLLNVFGTECFVYLPKSNRKKWDKSVNGILVRYSGEKDGYKVYIKEQDKVL